jgi:integrase
MKGVFEKFPGSGVWWIRFADAAGKYRREKVGTKSAAITLYRMRKVQAGEGVKLPPLRRARVSFSELCDDAISYIKATYRRPADDVARVEVVRSWFPGQAAATIEQHHIAEACATAKTEKNWSLQTVHHYLNVASLIFARAVKCKKIKENPATGIERETLHNERVRFLKPEEEARLRAALRSNPEWATHEPEVDLAMNTGLRRSSMYGLVWDNVDLEARAAMIGKTKNGDPLNLPLNRAAIAALAVFRSRGDGTGVVVRNVEGNSVHTNAHWFVPAIRQAGIKNFHWHDLRHTFASRLRQNGVPLDRIAELLGHRGLAMTQRYAHLELSHLHAAVDLLNSTKIAPEPATRDHANVFVN